MIVEQLGQYRWRLPIGAIPGMRVPGILYANEKMIQTVKKDGSLQQLANAATLPGAVKAVIAMPDIHFGYGLPIGGVLATDVKTGCVTPGGVGYDINCGVRLVRFPLEYTRVVPELEKLVDRLYRSIPCGVGSEGKVQLKTQSLRSVLERGARWAIESGYGNAQDADYCEASGGFPDAGPENVSEKALERGKNQLGTLGSGNHFIEIQRITKIFDTRTASAYGLEKDRVTVMIHSGSRGLGHQVCTDYIKTMVQSMAKYSISVPDRQLACVPIHSPEGRRYLGAMRAAANYAWANRQCLTHFVREEFKKHFGPDCEMEFSDLVYDVAHNIVKIEPHRIDGHEIRLAVHRKGATRAFGPDHAELPEKYRSAGQPVLIPGDMGTASYVLAGTETAMNETFGSACHGAGRRLSRKAAMREARNRSIQKELLQKGIYVRADGNRTVAEEMPEAYKNISDVIDVIEKTGIARVVAELQPMGVLKG
jgi:tRNA-splicing ligase RtcB (3'-phosphate/5'-hydroxy nucleic acid ligase)